MFDFMKGEKVRVTGGRHEGKTGVATGNGSQISASDWPEIQIKNDEDGFCFYAYTDDVELVSDRYEYGVTWKMSGSEEYYPVFEDEWGTLEWAKDELKTATKDTVVRDPKIMRRLKAGKPEDYNV